MTVAAATISQRIERAFDTASRSTGTSFDYLLRTASQESSFDVAARAPTSTASGLFQFIESTWLEMVREAGPHLGLERHARHIERGGDGRYRVADPERRAEILDLRKDPETAALMAGAYARRNAKDLGGRLGRPASDGELYIAHFLGARGAAELITAAETTPQRSAGELFPRQARANREIFHDTGGGPRSAADVYRLLIDRHAGATVPVAQAAPARPPDGEAVAQAPAGAFAPPSTAAQRVLQGWQAADGAAPFELLFRTASTLPRDPVGPTVWTAFAARPDLMAVPQAQAPAATMAVPQTATAADRPETAAGPAVAGRTGPETATGRPLDLTGFAGYRTARGPRNLLPPA